MNDFGKIARYERAEYAAPIAALAVPLALYAPLPGSEAREFLFVPDTAALQDFPLFATFSHSAALGARFRYLGGSNVEIPVATAETRGVSRRRELRFALVRWARGSRTPFPREVLCAQQIPLTSAGATMIEVVRAHAIGVAA